MLFLFPPVRYFRCRMRIRPASKREPRIACPRPRSRAISRHPKSKQLPRASVGGRMENPRDQVGAPQPRGNTRGWGARATRCCPIFGWRTGSLYAEDREREKGNCNACCDNEESIRDVAHVIPRRQKEDVTRIPLSSQPDQLRAPPAWPPVSSKRAQPLSDCAPPTSGMSGWMWMGMAGAQSRCGNSRNGSRASLRTTSCAGRHFISNCGRAALAHRPTLGLGVARRHFFPSPERCRANQPRPEPPFPAGFSFGRPLVRRLATYRPCV
jgi:hypothetical protein